MTVVRSDRRDMSFFSDCARECADKLHEMYFQELSMIEWVWNYGNSEMEKYGNVKFGNYSDSW